MMQIMCNSDDSFHVTTVIVTLHVIVLIYSMITGFLSDECPRSGLIIFIHTLGLLEPFLLGNTDLFRNYGKHILRRPWFSEWNL